MPDTPPKAPALIAAAVLIAAPFAAQREGLITHPNRDPIGKQEVCYGETNVPMRVYTADQCGAMLRAKLTKVYAPAILQCVPELKRSKYIFAASLDLSYNIGTGAFCHSLSAREFRAGEYSRGCNHLIDWEAAGGRKLPGLVKRREAEKALCLKGVA